MKTNYNKIPPYRWLHWMAEIIIKDTRFERKIHATKHLFLSIITLIMVQMGSIALYAQNTLQAAGKMYVFMGNGNWSIAGNWTNNLKPPAFLPNGDTIRISTNPGDSCILDIAQYLDSGTVFQLSSESHLIIKGSLINLDNTPATLLDTRDGQIYTIKKYGAQTWMTMNLNYNIAGSNVYGNNPANALVYGRLYPWDEAKVACPAGWHLPSLAEWNVLGNLIGNGGAMKDTLYWQPPNTAATNIVRFNARPGGFKTGSQYEELGYEGRWWTSTPGDWEYKEKPSYFVDLIYNYATFGSSYDWRFLGYSVRCVKN